MRTPVVPVVAFLVAVPAAAPAFQADLVPASRRPEAADITGAVSIGGADGTIRAVIENVNDALGDPLDATMILQLKLLVNGQRRRVAVPLPVDTGDGEATRSLGLVPGDQIVVQDIRVRLPGHRTFAQAGVVTEAVVPPPPPPPPPPPDQCPEVLASCQGDLVDCEQELDECESGF